MDRYGKFKKNLRFRNRDLGLNSRTRKTISN